MHLILISVSKTKVSHIINLMLFYSVFGVAGFVLAVLALPTNRFGWGKIQKYVINSIPSRLCQAVTYLVPNTYGPRTFGPPQLVPNWLVPLDKRSPTNSVPMDKWSPKIWSPWTNGPQPIWSPYFRIPTACPPGQTGPFVLGDSLSRGTNQLGTNCGGPNVRGPYVFRTKYVTAFCLCSLFYTCIPAPLLFAPLNFQTFLRLYR